MPGRIFADFLVQLPPLPLENHPLLLLFPLPQPGLSNTHKSDTVNDHLYRKLSGRRLPDRRPRDWKHDRDFRIITLWRNFSAQGKSERLRCHSACRVSMARISSSIEKPPPKACPGLVQAVPHSQLSDFRLGDRTGLEQGEYTR